MPSQSGGEGSIFAPSLIVMTLPRTVLGLIAAATLSLAVAPIALASPAGSEYLPKIPQSGAHSSSGGTSQGTGTTTLPDSSSGSSTGSSKDNGQAKQKKGKDQSNQAAAPASSGSGGSGGSGGDGSSGSILLNPIVLLMIAAVIAAAAGMILRRRQAGDDDQPEPRRTPGSRTASPRTPDGEIIAGRDKAA